MPHGNQQFLEALGGLPSARWLDGSPPTAGPRKGPLAPSGLMSPLDSGRIGGCVACKEQGVTCLGHPALQVTAPRPHPEAKKKKMRGTLVL